MAEYFKPEPTGTSTNIHRNALHRPIPFSSPSQTLPPPRPAGAEYEGAPVLEAGFRGRFMKGSEVALPDGFGGAVLERRTQTCDGGEAAAPVWTATASFSSFHCWNHDTAPTPTDGVRRAIEWAALAAHIHRPVDPEAVEKAEAAAAATAAEPTQS